MNAKELRELLMKDKRAIDDYTAQTLLQWLKVCRDNAPLAVLMVGMAESDPEWLDWLEYWLGENLSPDANDGLQEALIDAKWTRDEQQVELDRVYARSAAPAFEQAFAAIKALEGKAE